MFRKRRMRNEVVAVAVAVAVAVVVTVIRWVGCGVWWRGESSTMNDSRQDKKGKGGERSRGLWFVV